MHRSVLLTVYFQVSRGEEEFHLLWPRQYREGRVAVYSLREVSAYIGPASICLLGLRALWRTGLRSCLGNWCGLWHCISH